MWCVSCFISAVCVLFFYWYVDHRGLHVLTHSFPTRRSSDLGTARSRRVRLRRAGGGLPLQDPRVPKGQCGASACSLEQADGLSGHERSEEHTSELPSLMRISYAVFCLKKKIRGCADPTIIASVCHHISGLSTR